MIGGPAKLTTAIYLERYSREIALIDGGSARGTDLVNKYLSRFSNGPAGKILNITRLETNCIIH